MDNKDYKYATLGNRQDTLDKISKLEDELSRKEGNDIVLIAYTKEKQK